MQSFCHWLIAWILFAPTAVVAAAEPVFVHGQENGQGVLRVRNGECFAITPDHVVGYGLGLSVATADRTHAPAEKETTFGDDMAVLRVNSRGRLNCGVGWVAQKNFEEKLRAAVSQRREGAIVRVRQTGGLESYAVRFIGYDDRYIEVAPSHHAINVFKGVSGSTLLLDGLPAGMVVSVDTELGVVRAYRHDALTHLVSRFFKTSGPQQAPATDQPIEPLTGIVMATARTAIREEPSRWSPIVRWLTIGQSVEVTGKVGGLPWLQTREGYVRVGDTTTQ